ncbi:MAG: NAD(P)-dependent oxidoreductase, partial [Mycobacteriales bacterium]
MTEEPWGLLALPPAPDGLLEQVVAGLPVRVSRPAERTPEGLCAALAGAELVLGDWTGTLGLDAGAFAAADRLAFVQMPTVGVDSVDLEAAAARGVPVANAAGANAVSVAEWCVGAALALIRRLVAADAAVRAGEWPQTGLGIRELAGMRAGVIGMGPIGAGVAARLGAFGTDVSYWSRSRRPDGAVPARWCELDELLATSELLVVVIALAPATRGLLSADRLALLAPGAFVVNASRGGVVDEVALAGALAAGRLGGLAADVFEQEPLP